MSLTLFNVRVTAAPGLTLNEVMSYFRPVSALILTFVGYAIAVIVISEAKTDREMYCRSIIIVALASDSALAMFPC
jgi:hypothetical protein